MEFEDDDMKMGKDNEMEEEKGRERDMEEVNLEAPQENPKKRKSDQALSPNQALPQDHPDAQLHETPNPNLPISPLEEMIEIMVEKGGEVIRKNRRRAWRNINMDNVRFGIVREPLNIQVLGDLNNKTRYDELIDPALLVISDNVHETTFNFLNNVKNILIDNILIQGVQSFHNMIG